MPTAEQFFKSPSEQSKIKVKIVASYFSAWSKVIRDHWDHSIPIGYIDLFCGPGIYEDGTKSVPLLLVEKVLEDSELSNRMLFAFNDRDVENIRNLQSSIASIPGAEKISSHIQYSHSTIDENFAHKIVTPPNVPILSFVDPFGYKGLSKELINKLIKNNGSDCIFFFNYNRINMALSSNTKFDEYLVGIFGIDRTKELKNQLLPLSSAQREPIVLNALMGALREGAANYALPFKFYSVDMHRTSHFIIFVSKHEKGFKIMKEIMYSNSAKDIDDVATFEFKDSHNFNNSFEQLSMFNQPLKILCNTIYTRYHGKQINVGLLCNSITMDVNNYFVEKNVKEALRRLEIDGKLTVSGRKQKFRKGSLTMPDKAIVNFK